MSKSRGHGRMATISGLIASFLFASLTLWAQTTGTGTIDGTVTDATGAIIAGVQVTATQVATGVSRTTTTNAAGFYVLTPMQIGQYKVTASRAGFSAYDRSGVILDADSRVTVNIPLSVGASTQTITVVDKATTLHTETGAVNTVVSGALVQELALNGRNFSQLLTLGPGVVSEQTDLRMGVSQEGNPLMSVNGGRINATAYTFDGVLAMDTGGNRGINLFPPQEAIDEVQVHKSNYSADTGSYGYGQVNVVTKSGGSEFHGTLYEVNGNADFDARNFFSATVPPFNQNMFGFTIGGPVFAKSSSSKHDKVFFFWSEGWNRRIGPNLVNFTSAPQSVFTATTPTAAQREGNFGSTIITNPATGQPFPNNIINVPLDPNAVLLLQNFYPLPNRSGSPNYSFSTDSRSNWREELGRTDIRISNKLSLMVRYAQDTWREDENILAPSNAAFPTEPGFIAKPGKNGVISLTDVFSPYTVNQFTLGFSRNAIQELPGSQAQRTGLTIPSLFGANTPNVIPNITISGYSNIGVSGVTNNANPVTTYRDDLTHQIGNHTLKAGFDFMRIVKFSFFPINGQAGAFTFNGAGTNTTGNALADFLLGNAYEYTEQSAIPPTYEFANTYELYFQDDWKVRHNLTINLGLRNGIYAGAPDGREKYNNISNFVPSLYNPADAPTVLSNGRLVAGTGDPLNGIITPANQKGLSLPPALKTTRYDNLGPRVGFAWSLGKSQKTVVRGGYGIFYHWDGDNDESMSQNPPFSSSASIFNTHLSSFSTGTGATFPPGLTAEDINSLYPMVQQWSFTVEREIPSNTVLSIAYVGNRASHLDQSFNINQPQPNLLVPGGTNLSTIVPYLGYGSISFDDRNAAALYNSLQFDARHRVGHGLTFEAGYTWSRSLCWQVGQNTLTQQNEEGLCSLNRTNNFTFSYVYSLPFYREQKGLTGKVLGGWEWSGTATYASGLPLTVAETGNRSGTGNAGRPNLVGPLNIQPRNVSAYFNTAAFAAPALGQFGNEGVDILTGPGPAVWNMNLYKDSSVHLFRDKQANVKFGVEFFNVFNQVSFNGVGTTYGSATFGHITSALDPREADFKVSLTY